MTKIDFAKRHHVRFWTWWRGGWVKLTLRPDQEIKASFGYRHEEGYHWEGHYWAYDPEAGEVISTVTEEGSDCDGRLDRYWSGFATEYDDEFVDQEDGQYYRRLRYQTRSRSQRDHTAEAMGY